MRALKYYFVTDIPADRWPALPRDFKMGDEVELYTGHTYGLDRDDFIWLGISTVACTEGDPKTPFFTVPVTMLVDTDGNPPRSPYVRLGE